jgi:hypothetical protein
LAINTNIHAVVHTCSQNETVFWSGSSPSVGTPQGRAIVRDISNYHIVGLASAGGTTAQEGGTALALSAVTPGASGSATFSVAGITSGAPANTVPWKFLAPHFYVTDGTNFYYYSYLSNSWTTLSTTGLTAGTGSGKLVVTPSWTGSAFRNYFTGTLSTSATGGATTLTFTGTSWATNQWANYQIMVTQGTSAGLIRTILSNTSNTLTLSAAIPNTINTSSNISIQPNDDYIYYISSSTTAVHRYSISANTWTALTPGTARAGAPSNGCSATWIGDATASTWNNSNAILNGRRIYCYRGGSTSSAIDIYDIPSNSWSVQTNALNREIVGVNAKSFSYKNKIYTYINNGGMHQKIISFDVTTNIQKTEMTFVAATSHGHSFSQTNAFAPMVYTDGATEILYAYTYNVASMLLRTMLF